MNEKLAPSKCDHQAMRPVPGASPDSWKMYWSRLIPIGRPSNMKIVFEGVVSCETRCGYRGPSPRAIVQWLYP